MGNRPSQYRTIRYQPMPVALSSSICIVRHPVVAAFMARDIACVRFRVLVTLLFLGGIPGKAPTS